jgi:hypothetical protein
MFVRALTVRRWWPAALVILTLLAFVFSSMGVRAAGAEEFPLTYGWYEGRSTFYYNFSNPIPSADGGLTVTPAPIYVFFYADDTMVAGQHNIIDVVPGDAGYSDLWQVHKVTVPDDYVADTIRSYADIVSAGYPVTATDIYVNCPVVPAASTLQYSQQPLTQGWYQDAEVYYFDFGPNSLETAPIYVLFYGDNTPVAGQRNIIDTVPGEPDYSAFWRVHMVTVPDDYVVNSATSLADIQAAGYTITPTTMLVNCPVVRTEEPAQTFGLTDGWYDHRPVTYYNFNNPVPSPDGGATVIPAPIYVLFYDDGTPVPGQNNIIDVVPGDDGYSDLWQVHQVTVPDDYSANSVRSYAQIVAAGYSVTPLEMYVNCPVVPEGSSLSGGEPGLTAGWYRGQSVFYFDFGLNPTASAPIYVFFYDDGMPVAGQNNVIDTIPGLPNYSAFWQVHMVTVPDDYVANSATSLMDIMAAGYTITPTDILVNCPVEMLEPTDVALSSFGQTNAPAPALLLVAVGGGIALLWLALNRKRRVGQAAG